MVVAVRHVLLALFKDFSSSQIDLTVFNRAVEHRKVWHDGGQRREKKKAGS